MLLLLMMIMIASTVIMKKKRNHKAHTPHHLCPFKYCLGPWPLSPNQIRTPVIFATSELFRKQGDERKKGRPLCEREAGFSTTYRIQRRLPMEQKFVLFMPFSSAKDFILYGWQDITATHSVSLVDLLCCRTCRNNKFWMAPTSFLH